MQAHDRAPRSGLDAIRSSLALVRVVVTEPDLRRIELASLVSTTARWAYLVAVLVVAYELAGAVGLAALGILRTVPTAIAVPLLGALGARVPGRQLLLATYGLRAATLLAAVAGAMAGLPVLVFAPLAVDAILGVLRRPVQAALLPLVTRTPRDLVAANVATSTGDGVAGIVGPLIGTIILAAAGPGAVLVVSAGGFAAAAILIAGVSVRGGHTDLVTGSVSHALRNGASTLLRTPLPRLVTIGFMLQVLVRGVLNVAIVPVAASVSGLGDAGVGSLYAAIGIGSLLGAGVAIASIGPGRLVGTFVASLAAWGLPLVLLGVTESGLAAIMLLGVVGVANACFDVAGYSLLQRTLPSGARASGLALFEGLAEAVIGLGALAAPLLLATIGLGGSLIACGMLLVAGALVLVVPLRTHRAELARRTSDVVALQAVDLLSLLPLASVEALAGDATTVRFAPGEPLMRQGDHGDRYLVITAGNADVFVDGRQVNHVHAGTGVGEIALLRDVARTATVVATTPLIALAIDGSAFLQAVSNHPGSLSSASEVVDRRLAAHSGHA